MQEHLIERGLVSNNSNTDYQNVSYQEILLETSDNDNNEKNYSEADGQCPQDQNISHLNAVERNEDSVESAKSKLNFRKNDPVLNISKKDGYNSDSNKPFINELKLIPRNKISAFKAFRNCTFKLVPTSSSNQSLMNNSNNSNRFSIGKSKGFNGSNSNVNSNDVYINKINRKIMLKKITELANPYEENSKPFKRLIPHPIIDDKKYRDLFQISLTSDTNDDFTGNPNILNEENEDNSELVVDNEVLNKNNEKLFSSQLSLNDSIDIETYENILINKLNEIRNLKSQSNNLKNTRYTKSTAELSNFPIRPPSWENKIILHKTGVEKTGNDSILGSCKRTASSLSCHLNKDLNSSKLIEPCHSFPEANTENNDAQNDILNKSVNNLIRFKNNPYKSKSLKTPTEFSYENSEAFNPCLTNDSKANEVEVCVEQNYFSEHKKNNVYIPLYFKCVKGKKIKFKIRYLSKILKAQKAFCSRMSIHSLSDVRFETENGQMITETDSPCSLHLKPNDVIIVSISPCLREGESGKQHF